MKFVHTKTTVSFRYRDCLALAFDLIQGDNIENRGLRKFKRALVLRALADGLMNFGSDGLNDADETMSGEPVKYINIPGRHCSDLDAAHALVQKLFPNLDRS